MTRVEAEPKGRGIVMVRPARERLGDSSSYSRLTVDVPEAVSYDGQQLTKYVIKMSQ